MAVEWRRLAVGLLLVAAGWAGAAVAGPAGVSSSATYRTVTVTLLAIGLYGSTSSIPLPELRRHAGTVVLAVTVGVLVKAALVGAVMWAVLGDPVGLVLGVAVAQIDPLSVAAMQQRDRLSPSARTVLTAWASFDDPVTTVLAVYLSAVLVRLRGDADLPAARLLDADPRSFGLAMLANAAFVVLGYGCWRAVRPRAGRTGTRALPVLVLLALAGVAVWQFLLLGLAVTGLFFGPAVEPALRRLVGCAFGVATVLLGVLLVGGVRVGAGLLLGGTAYLAQMVAAPLVAHRQSRRDRVSLALGQQNGITAIVLALLLEQIFPGVAAVIAPAVVTVNVLHVLANRGHWSPLQAGQSAGCMRRTTRPPTGSGGFDWRTARWSTGWCGRCGSGCWRTCGPGWCRPRWSMTWTAWPGTPGTWKTRSRLWSITGGRWSG